MPVMFLRMRSTVAVLACTFPVACAFNQVLCITPSYLLHTLKKTQLVNSFALYVEARSFDREPNFEDWALSFVYFGRPVGVIFSGLLIKRYFKFRPMLQLSIIVSILIYLSFALGWIRRLTLPIMQALLTIYIEPENPTFVPFLVVIGLNLGVSESCLVVSLLSVVGKEGEHTTTMIGKRIYKFIFSYDLQIKHNYTPYSTWYLHWPET